MARRGPSSQASQTAEPDPQESGQPAGQVTGQDVAQLPPLLPTSAKYHGYWTEIEHLFEHHLAINLSSNIYQMICQKTSLRDKWNMILQLKTEADLYIITRQLHAIKFEPKDTVNSFIIQLQYLWSKLKCHGQRLSDTQKTEFLMIKLEDGYPAKTQYIRQLRDLRPLTWDNIAATYHEAEQCKPSETVTAIAAANTFLHKTKCSWSQDSSSSSEPGESEFYCYICEESGHQTKHCHLLKKTWEVWEKQKQKSINQAISIIMNASGDRPSGLDDTQFMNWWWSNHREVYQIAGNLPEFMTFWNFSMSWEEGHCRSCPSIVLRLLCVNPCLCQNSVWADLFLTCLMMSSHSAMRQTHPQISMANRADRSISRGEGTWMRYQIKPISRWYPYGFTRFLLSWNKISSIDCLSLLLVSRETAIGCRWVFKQKRKQSRLAAMKTAIHDKPTPESAPIYSDRRYDRWYSDESLADWCVTAA